MTDPTTIRAALEESFDALEALGADLAHARMGRPRRFVLIGLFVASSNIWWESKTPLSPGFPTQRIRLRLLASPVPLQRR